MTNPSETIKRFVQERRAVEGKATRVVRWYSHGRGESPHPDHATVRGPFNRWFLVTPVAGPYVDEVASQADDAEFCADAMNSVPLLLKAVEEMAECLATIRECAMYPNQYDLQYAEHLANASINYTAELLGGEKG